MPQTVLEGSAFSEPPPFLQLAAHPVRWRLLQELVQSDRAVWELTERVGGSQSLVSYHLRHLRDGGLVSMRRSSADGRDTYYAIDLARCGTELQAAGGALHPALWLVPASDASRETGGYARRRRVLFLCTGNSARSQIAEALIEQMSQGSVRAASAGSNPKPLHPNAVRVMRRRGIDISGNRTKHLDEFLSKRFDAVITLCDRVREVCPEFPSHPELAHWSIAEPASYREFERTASELETRIRFFLALLDGASSRRSRHAKR
jgi:protein-tyrosine-phosphatase/DNA-binding transcriptional ArsR family regulator